MAIGERIRYLRNIKGITQKQLGMMIGYSEKTSDIRIAQYESGARKPKKGTIDAIAYTLGVSPRAIMVPDIDTYLGILHTLFALEDILGIHTEKMEDGRICLIIEPDHSRSSQSLPDMIRVWHEEYEALQDKKITQEEYDKWRYNYPEHDNTLIWGKTIPADLSDELLKKFNNKEKD